MGPKRKAAVLSDNSKDKEACVVPTKRKVAKRGKNVPAQQEEICLPKNALLPNQITVDVPSLDSLNKPESVELVCLKINSKLRVRILSPGYFHEANCQFPRAIRVEGRHFQVSANNIKLVQARGKYYYTIPGHAVSILNEPTQNSTSVNDSSNKKSKTNTQVTLTVFQDDNCNECCVCLCEEKSIVFGCGHFYTCSGCAKQLKQCPICRSPITMRIDKNNIG